MSATRDPSEKITFLFNPMAGLVRKIKDTPLPAAEPQGRASRKPVIRPQQRPLIRPSMAVREHRARELSSTIPASAQALFRAGVTDSALSEQRAGLAGLQKSLGELDQLQKRFRFLIQELEDLIQD
jgi:hypothetical protein